MLRFISVCVGKRLGATDERDLWTDIWATEPAVGRVAHGISDRSHRLRCLGNAVVPQCAAVIASYLVKHYLKQSLFE